MKGRSIVVRRPGNLGPQDVRVRKGIRVTSIERTLPDLAGLVRSDRLEAATHDALRRRLTTTPRIAAALERAGCQGRRGAADMRGLLEDLRECRSFYGSRFEVIVSRILTSAGLPPPVRQFPLSDGRHTIHPDLCYPEARVAIEADSFICHGTKEAFYSDRWRDNFIRDKRWDGYRATWWDTKSPQGLIDFVGARVIPTLA